MKRVIIICEGETEQEFCKKILNPFFASKNIFIEPPLIKKSMGGIVNWSELKRQIHIHLNEDKHAFISTFIDYYGLYSNHKFPGWDDAMKIINRNKRISYLESQMHSEINDDLSQRFIPYIQLHEFEGLLFNNLDVFREQIPKTDLTGLKELKETLSNYPNPELINDKRETSPSHRLMRIINGYNKIVYGNILADAIGLENIRQKCPRFNEWLGKIETIS